MMGVLSFGALLCLGYWLWPYAQLHLLPDDKRGDVWEGSYTAVRRWEAHRQSNRAVHRDAAFRFLKQALDAAAAAGPRCPAIIRQRITRLGCADLLAEYDSQRREQLAS